MECKFFGPLSERRSQPPVPLKRRYSSQTVPMTTSSASQLTEAPIMTASQQLGAMPAGEYSWRAPSPPHIPIPQLSEDQQLVLPQFKGLDPGDDTRDVLRVITPAQYFTVEAFKGGEWRYEYRRKAQNVLSFLYLGPSAAARDIEALRMEGITMLLVIRNTMTAQAKILSGDKIASELGIASAAVDVAGNQELIAAFPCATKIINDHLVATYHHRIECGRSPADPSNLGKVLVFCESGNERSAAVVAAYLMEMYDIDLVSAIQFVQSQRFCVAFDDPLKHLLLSYQQLLEAKRISRLQQSKANPSAGSRSGSKRGRDDMVDDDMDMDLDNADDEERFGGRRVFAAFHDRSSS